MWNQDHFGFPINARPYSAIGSMEKIEISEVLNRMVKRACLFEMPKTTTTTTTTTTGTTTAYRSSKVKTMKDEDEAEVKKEEVDRVLKQFVGAEAVYPDLVSIKTKQIC